MTASDAHRGVRVRGLEKAFGKKHEVLKGVDLDVAPGEVVGLIGPNGAGKTTLMSCLLGFLFVNGGEITIDGLPNDDISVRRRTGFVPERMNFDRRATGGEFLRYMARLDELSPAEARRRTDELMLRLDIAGAAKKRLSQYSRGMLQRIGMCQALAKRPDFLFLDEPTSGLDPEGVLLVRDAIMEEKHRGAAVLLNSHQLAEVEKVCDRVLFLSGGVVTEQSTIRSMTEIPIVITLMAGSIPAGLIEAHPGAIVNGDAIGVTVHSEGEIADLVQRLVEEGGRIVDVRRSTADLEQLFRRGR